MHYVIILVDKTYQRAVLPLKQAEIPTDVQIIPTPILPNRREFLRPTELARNQEMILETIDRPETISSTMTELDGVIPAVIRK